MMLYFIVCETLWVLNPIFLDILERRLLFWTSLLKNHFHIDQYIILFLLSFRIEVTQLTKPQDHVQVSSSLQPYFVLYDLQVIMYFLYLKTPLTY